MAKYNKFLGAIVGSVIGMGLVAIGLGDASGVSPEFQPFVDALTLMVTSALGTYIAPKNAE